MDERRYVKEHLEQLHQRDQSANEETMLPQDEGISLSAIGAVEFYSPAHIDLLAWRLQEFGWVSDDPISSTRDPGKWLERTQQNALSGGWITLGPILRSKEDGNYHLRHIRALPANIKYVKGQLRQLTPSLFCIVLWFLCDETYANALSDILMNECTTYAEDYRRGVVFQRPGNQKADKVREFRMAHDASITHWYRRHLPGVFSSREGSMVPTAEVLVATNVQPFPMSGESDGTHKAYLNVLGVLSSHRSWLRESIRSLRIGLSDNSSFVDARPFIISVGDEDITGLARRMNYGQSSTRILCIEEEISESLCIHGIVSLLDRYAGTIREIRESGVFRSKSKRTVLRRLRELSEGISSSADIMNVTFEIEEYARGPFFGPNMKSFRSCQPALYGQETTLADHLRESILARTKWLRIAEESLRTHLTQHGTLLGGRETLVLTWLVVALTVIVLVSTVVAQYAQIRGALDQLIALAADWW